VEVHLTRQWLTQAVQEYDYISVPILAEEGSRFMFVFQILGVNKKFIGVKVLPLEEPVQEELLFEVMSQSMSRWCPLAADEEVVPATMDVFAYADPSSVDILTVTGLRPETRHELIRWQVRQSDVEGCSELYNPEPVNVNMELSSASCPALCILDELARRGFVAHMGLVVHTHLTIGVRWANPTSEEDVLEGIAVLAGPLGWRGLVLQELGFPGLLRAYDQDEEACARRDLREAVPGDDHKGCSRPAFRGGCSLGAGSEAMPSPRAAFGGC